MPIHNTYSNGNTIKLSDSFYKLINERTTKPDLERDGYTGLTENIMSGYFYIISKSVPVLSLFEWDLLTVYSYSPFNHCSFPTYMYESIFTEAEVSSYGDKERGDKLYEIANKIKAFPINVEVAIYEVLRRIDSFHSKKKELYDNDDLYVKHRQLICLISAFKSLNYAEDHYADFDSNLYEEIKSYIG